MNFNGLASVFGRLSKREKSDLSEWLVRQYFSSEESNWYNPEVNTNNVLEYVSNYENNFPYTPRNIVALFKLKGEIESDLKNYTVEELDALIKPPKSTTTRRRLDNHLIDIALANGLSTASSTRKVIKTAFEKLRNLIGECGVDSITIEQERELDRKLNRALLLTAEVYSDALSKSSNYQEFVERLYKNKYLWSHDISLIDDCEKEHIETYAGKDKELIKEIVLIDFEDERSVFHSFQMLYSRFVHNPVNDFKLNKRKL